MRGTPANVATPWYRSRGAWIKLGVSVTVTVVLLYFLISGTQEELSKVVEPEFRPGYLFLALGAYLFVALFRALRFKLIHRELGGATLGQWLQVAVIHAGLNQVLPFRSGESTYPYLLHRVHGVTVGRSVFVLLSARILDLLCNFLLSIGFVFLLAEGALQTDRSLFILVAGAVVVVCLVALVGMRPVLRALLALTGRGDAEAPGIRASLHRRAGRLLSEAQVFRSWGHFATTFLLSAALWLCLFTTFWALLNGFGHEIPLPVAVIGTVGAAMMNVLPVNGVANFGTHEAGWTLGLMLAGLTRDQGLAAGLWAHLGTMALAVAFGLVGFVAMKLASKKASPAHD